MLIHAGDISYKGKESEVEDFIKWFAKQDFKHKIFIAGNHDFYFEKEKAAKIKMLLPDSITYLKDEGTEVEGIKIWGSPYTPWFFNWAFNERRGELLDRHWQKIPNDTDVLLTHGPPFGILDMVINEQNVGCKNLLQRVLEVKPKVHVYGHIHEDYGSVKRHGIRFINASVLNEVYELVNKPIVFDL